MHKKIANMYLVSSGYTYIDFLKQEKNTVKLQQKSYILTTLQSSILSSNKIIK